jgi:hypothetical protein
MSSSSRPAALEQLRAHVLSVLCSQDGLDPAQTPLTHTVVRKRGRPCGLFFQLVGPRRVRSHAIWSADEGRILFYGSNGARFAEAPHPEGPDPRHLG